MEFILIFFTTPPLIAQAVINGIIIGSLFGLAAYGLSLVWGVMHIINIAQGDLVILGGYICYTLVSQFGMNPLVTIPICAFINYFVGWFIFKSVIFRVLGKDLFISLLATFGLSVLIQQLMNLYFGGDVQTVNADLGTTFIGDDGIIAIPNIRLVILVVALFITGFVVFFMKFTKIGKAINATAQNARAARILGIDTDKIYRTTFSINAAICGAAGALVVMTFTIHPYIGLVYTVRSFMIVIFAGLGNFAGVIVSAMGLGTVEEISDFIFGSEFRLAIVFSLLVLFLIYRSWRLNKTRNYLK